MSNAIYKNRDNCFYASIAQDSSNYFKNTITMRKKGNLNWASKAAEIWGTPISGYVYRKGVYEAVRLLNSEPTLSLRTFEVGTFLSELCRGHVASEQSECRY